MASKELEGQVLISKGNWHFDWKLIDPPKCSICKRILDDPHNFPDWYPDKYKMCCRCHAIFWRDVNGLTQLFFSHPDYFNTKSLNHILEKAKLICEKTF